MKNILSVGTNFTARNISPKRAVQILAKNNIEINDSEAAIFLNFLYQIAQNHNKHKAYKKIVTPTRNRTY